MSAVAVVIEGIACVRDGVVPVHVINDPVTVVINAVSGDLARVTPQIRDEVGVGVIYAGVDDEGEELLAAGGLVPRQRSVAEAVRVLERVEGIIRGAVGPKSDIWLTRRPAEPPQESLDRRCAAEILPPLVPPGAVRLRWWGGGQCERLRGNRASLKEECSGSELLSSERGEFRCAVQACCRNRKVSLRRTPVNGDHTARVDKLFRCGGERQERAEQQH